MADSTSSVSPTDRIFILAGAGVSAESGIPTFRGVGGLWRNYRIEEVASPEAWHRDPQLVWDFYSMRRRVAPSAKPNPAHFTLAKLENTLQGRLFVCTQNVDSLHEQAGRGKLSTCTESFSRAVATVATALHLRTQISTSHPHRFPGANAAVGFVRTFAVLAKCRSNWIESIAHWINLRSS
jgi:NAD-dependent SIR2 family protein deacetylase